MVQFSMTLPDFIIIVLLRMWSPRQESNLYLALRRRPFYPLNYEEIQARIVAAAAFSGQSAG